MFSILSGHDIALAFLYSIFKVAVFTAEHQGTVVNYIYTYGIKVMPLSRDGNVEKKLSFVLFDIS